MEIRQAIFEELEQDWRRLEAEGNIPYVYQLFDWVRIWWAHHATCKRTALILAGYENGTVCGIAPLYTDTFRIKGLSICTTIRHLGAREVDYFAPVCSAQHLGSFCAALGSYFAAEFPHAIVHLTDLPVAVAEGIALGFEGWRTRIIPQPELSSPHISLDGTWDQFYAGLGKSMRKTIRWQQNKLETEWHAETRIARTYSNSDTDSLFRLHYRRWKMDSRSKSIADLEEYERDCMRFLSDSGRLGLVIITQREKTIASLFFYDYNGRRYFHKAGFDPGLRHLSLGSIVILRAIQDAYECGLSIFDFLRGNEPYKRRFADKETPQAQFLAARSGVPVLLYKALCLR